MTTIDPFEDWVALPRDYERVNWGTCPTCGRGSIYVCTTGYDPGPTLKFLPVHGKVHRPRAVLMGIIEEVTEAFVSITIE